MGSLLFFISPPPLRDQDILRYGSAGAPDIE